MAKLVSFMTLSVDGYYSRPDGDLGFAHRSDPEFDAFVADNARSGGNLLFGRVTYEMMLAYWPTPAAHANMPVVADGMKRASKFVTSRTLKDASWANTTLLKGPLVNEIEQLKRDAKQPIVILGSASLVTQLSDAGLIDEYQIVLAPVALGAGRSLFAGMQRELALELTETRKFSNGNVFLRYASAR
ncbi:MAG TPA: dihydrofolate reductase family protein [Polyangiaceae bacterium]|nr:dihydrofolate reductase family protein [Polyangiaceae bacterium]